MLGRRLRIAIDARLAGWRQPTGTNRYSESLLRALAETDDANDYVLLDTRSRHHTASTVAGLELGANFTTRRLAVDDRLVRAVWLIAGRPAVEQIVGSIDILHVPSGEYVPSRHAVRIQTIHDVTFLTNRRVHRWRDRQLHKAALYRSVKRADVVITPSHHTASQLDTLLGIDGSRVRVIAEAPDSVFCSIPDAGDVDVRSRLNVNGPYLLFVGTIEPRKNLQRLIEAIAVAREQAGIPHSLVVVGRDGWLCGPILKQLESAREAGTVQRVGYLSDSDLAALYRGADALVVPSLDEGFGLPAVEAMASGTPVIASARGSLREVVGSAALLVDPLDVGSIRHAIVALLTNQSLGQQLRKRSVARARLFTWQRTAEETLLTYVEAVSNRRNRAING